MWRVLYSLGLFLLIATSCSPAGAACPDGTVRWDNGHCYEAVLAPGVSWDQAQAQCVARGGHLVTITSAAENAFVFSLVSDNPSFWVIDGFGNGLGPWLGGYQVSGSADPAAGWRWVTDEPFYGYTNWDTGQPGDMEDMDQNRLRFFKTGGLIGDRWDDCEANNPLAHRLGYIFERDSETTNAVDDGYGHRLVGVEVTLMAAAPEGSSTVAVTLTDDEGEYSFTGIDDGDYQIEVALEYHKAVGDTAIFSVNYDAGAPVHVQTETFEVTDGRVARSISFADANLIPAAGIPQDRLDDLAGVYYHTKQAVDFELQELGVTPDLDLPVEVRAYRLGSRDVYYSGGEISIGDAVSGYNNADRAMNREWHEMFHEFMDDTVGIPPFHTGDANHDGFKNHCTGDSWVEGWAEFWSCALKGHLGSVDWRVYEWAGGNTNLEYIWTAWDDEEFAVASLMVDLTDPVEPADADYVSLTNSQLWSIIGSQSLADISDVYGAMVSANVGQFDTDTDNITDLDELFIMHGFFADDGNHQYDGEAVGLGGKPGRTDKVPIPGTSLRVKVVDSQGNPVSNGTLLVYVSYPSPLDIYDYDYEVSLSGSDSEVGFYVAPEGDDAVMEMRVRDAEGALSDELVVSNSVYWQKVSESTMGYAAEHTFVIGAEDRWTELGVSSTTSGGLPVWVWLVVGVGVAVVVGTGGLLLFRRRAKPA